ncbi:MAG TPA: helix-turn-helix transcriptional regulator [Actinomycetota bacterium]|nr:helix-turn-helix transcriptional regulator [Actinomycetota bacterium]
MSRDDKAGLGERIRRARIERGLSQRDLAVPLLTPSYVSLIESGKRIPSPDALEHIASALGMDPLELRTGRSPGAEAELEIRLQEARRALHSGEREVATAVAGEVREEARADGWPRVEAKALCVLAVVKEHEGSPEEAMGLYRESEDLWRTEPLHLRYEAVAGVARCTLEAGDSRLAIHILNEYIERLERGGESEPVALMRAHGALVACYMRVGLRNRAAHEAEQALRYAPLMKDPAELACLYMNVAGSMRGQGRHSDAVDAARKAEHYFSMLDWKLGAAWAQMNRGIVLLEKHDLAEARAAFEEALERLGSIANAEADRANVLNELAQVERLSGRPARAQARASEARALLGRDGPPIILATNHREMGRALVKKDPGAAERELRKAMRMFQDIGAGRDAAATARDLARVLRDRKKQREALAVLEEGLDMALEED